MMSPRRLAVLFVSWFFIFATPAAAQEITWKIATLAPKGIGWSQHIQEMIMPAFAKATNNNLDIKWYWGGIMGDDEDYIKKMRIGQIDGMGCSAQGMTLAIPEMQVLSLPFLFQSWDEVDHIRKVMYPVFDDYAEKHGFKLLFWADQDFDQIYSTDWEFNNLEDFHKAKFVAWFGPLETAVLNKLGANGVPVNVPEVPSAIRQGLVNADICPAVWVIAAQVYTVFKYVNTTKIRYSPAGVMISLDAWEDLKPEYQKAFTDERVGVAIEFCKLTRQDSDKAIDAMVKYGMHRVQIDPKSTARMKEICLPVWEEQAGNLYPRELMDEVVFQLENYRKMHN